jgi:hypothetical protein
VQHGGVERYMYVYQRIPPGQQDSHRGPAVTGYAGSTFDPGLT